MRLITYHKGKAVMKRGETLAEVIEKLALYERTYGDIKVKPHSKPISEKGGV